LVGVEWQGRGIATEAVIAVRGWLAARGVEKFTAHIHPEHAASHGVATALGLRPTELVDDDGEVVWASD
jgi:RimJ/RimL family protein N-acetyltransferase